MNILVRVVLVGLAVFAAQAYGGKSSKLEDIAVGSQRSEDNIARNQFRHPVETLKFFKVKPDMTVVEIWPGGGWYTEILAPYLHDKGTLYLADFSKNAKSEYFAKSRQKLRAKLEALPAVYGKVKLTEFNPPSELEIAPANSVDRVLTFRNAHNWYMRDGGEEKLLSAFKAFYTALKPGGMLGVVDHRLPENRPDADQESSGYLKQSIVIRLAEKAGFQLKKTSEVNANRKDTANHPKGVWTLPPSFALGEEDKSKYMDIGESDRMTLLFVKPKK